MIMDSSLESIIIVEINRLRRIVMRHQFFKQAQQIPPYAAATAGISFFSVLYLKGMMHAYHEHCEHEKKTPSAKINSTLWSRFSHTYFPFFPLIAAVP